MTKQQLIEEIEYNLAMAVDYYGRKDSLIILSHYRRAKIAYYKLQKNFKKVELFGTYLNVAVNKRFNPDCKLSNVGEVKEVVSWFVLQDDQDNTRLA